MAKFRTAKTNGQGTVWGQGPGLKGGLTTLSGSQIVCRVKVGANAEANGSIVRQKGIKKFVVSDGSNTGTCTLANTANASLANNTMTITCTYPNAATFRASRITNKYVWDQNNVKYIVSDSSRTASTDPDTVDVATT